MINENHVKTAAKLYECRDSAKSILGEKYHERLQPFTHILKEVMKSNKLDAIQALVKISKTSVYNQNSMSQLMFMSAVVESIEPSGK